MNYKKLFVLCALSTFAAVGCSDDKDKKENKPTSDMCSNYVTSCDGNVWKYCSDKTEKTTTCTAQERCDDAKGCVPASQEDICKNYVSTCNENVWKTCAGGTEKVIACKADQTCDANLGCVNDDKCDATKFQPKCDTRNNAWIKGCNGDDYVRVNCSNSQTCDDAKGCITATCDNDAPLSCNGTIATECVDGILRNTNCADTMQVCAPGKGCVVSASISCDPNTALASCDDDNVLHYCDPNDSITRTLSCPAGTYCDSDKIGCRKGTVEGDECTIDDTKCEGTMLWMCIDDGHGKGVWLGDKCSVRGKSCMKDDNGVAACKDVYSATCENNILTLCDGTSCIDENCTADGRLCDEEAQNCVEAPEFSCNESTITVKDNNGNFFAYDCASNNDAKRGCNTVSGCSNEFCTGSTYNLCDIDSNGYDCLTENCADTNTTCSDALKDCISCDPATFNPTCSGSTATICERGKIVTKDCSAEGLEEDSWSCVEGQGCVAANPCEVEDEFTCDDNDDKVYNLCIGGARYQDACGENSICDSSVAQCVFDITQLCGNGMLESGEKCDPGDPDNGISPARIYKSCNDLWPDSFKLGTYVGAPSCKSDCSKYDSKTCILADNIVTPVREWKFTDTESLSELAQSGLITTENITTVSADAGVMKTGFWGNSSSPAFDKRYIKLVPENDDVLQVGKYDVFGLRFNAASNEKGPQKLQVRFYNGDEAIDTSDVIDLTTTPTQHTVYVKVPSQYAGPFSVRISAYNSTTTRGGSMTISDLALVGGNE